MIIPCDGLPVLNLLGEHNDFMDSVENVAVMKSGVGIDAAWWADYQKDPDNPKKSYDIKVHAVDENVIITNANKRKNIIGYKNPIEDTGLKNNSIDVVWANDALRYSPDPFKTLSHWWNILEENSMLCLSVPQTAYIDDLSRWQVFGYSGNYFSWNIVNLIQILATCGFDCRDAHFKQTRHDPWIWAAVYKSNIPPMDPKTTTWYHLLEHQLTPSSLDECISKLGYVRHEFLRVEWINHSIYDLSVESLP